MHLHTPEYANFWADVRRGKSPMYYMGRGSVFDASDAAGQFFGTGVTPRVQYSNPKFDELLEAQYARGRPEEALPALAPDQPDPDRRRADALQMWTHTVVTGVRANVDLTVEPSGEFWLPLAKMQVTPCGRRARERTDGMLRAIALRLAGVLPVLFLVTLVLFVLLRLAPGDAADLLVPDDATDDEVRRVRERWGLDRPVIEQYWRFLRNI